LLFGFFVVKMVWWVVEGDYFVDSFCKILWIVFVVELNLIGLVVFNVYYLVDFKVVVIFCELLWLWGNDLVKVFGVVVGEDFFGVIMFM